MARYRVGDKYLSEDEDYKQQNADRKYNYFMVGFLISLVVLVFATPELFPQIESIAKWIRVVFYLAISIGIGVIASKMSKYIEAFLILLFALVIIVLLVGIIWSFV